MSATTREHHTVVVLTLLVLSFLILFGLLSATMATIGNPMGDITNMPGTINMYRHTNPGEALEYGNGNEVSAGGEALGGVPFTLYEVEGIDLVNSNASWDVVRRITDPAKPVESTLDNQNSSTKVTIDGKKYTLEKIDERTTADGTEFAQPTDVYPGLCVVVESEASLPPSSMTVVKMTPFFTIPSIKNTRGVWSHTANTYPRNIVSPKPERSAEVKNTADDVIIWTVEQTLPTFDNTNKFTEFRSEDDLSRADDTKDTLASAKVAVNGKDKTSDFNREPIGLDGKHLVITTKNSGDPSSDGRVVATYATKISGDGQFRNGVLSSINNVEVGRALIFAGLGKTTVEKSDTTDKTLCLSGAKFKVCIDEDGVEETKDCPAARTITTKKSLGTGPLDKLKIQKYVLFETTAPAGYTFSPDTPYKADLTTATYNTIASMIENMKTNVPTLPLVGADGQLLMTIGGVAFVFLAGGVSLVACKKYSKK